MNTTLRPTFHMFIHFLIYVWNYSYISNIGCVQFFLYIDSPVLKKDWKKYLRTWTIWMTAFHKRSTRHRYYNISAENDFPIIVNLNWKSERDVSMRNSVIISWFIQRKSLLFRWPSIVTTCRFANGSSPYTEREWSLMQDCIFIEKIPFQWFFIVKYLSNALS